MRADAVSLLDVFEKKLRLETPCATGALIATH
jgi:hypothetical protein